MMTLIGLIGLAVTLVLWARTRRPAWIFVLAICAVVAASDVLHLLLVTTLVLIGGIIVLAAILLFVARGVIRAALVAPLAVAVIAAGALFQGVMSSPAALADNSGAPNADTIKALTVTTASYTCQKDSNGLVAFDIGALKPVGDSGRKWSDAVSTPFKETAPAKINDELAQAICHDPLMGSMVANYFANLKLGDFEVASVNPWLNEFKGDAAKVINVKAASYIGLLNVQNPSADQVTKAAARNNDYQQLAAKAVTLLTKYAGGDVNADMSETNYHLMGGGLAADNLPAVGLNDKQENLPALQLVLTQKGQDVCLDKIGFNTGDKRLESFKCAPTPKCAAGTDKAGQMIPEGQTAEWCTTPKPAPKQTAPSTSTTPSSPTTPAPSCANCGPTHTTPCTTCTCLGNCVQKCTTCECSNTCAKCTTCTCLGTCPQPCIIECLTHKGGYTYNQGVSPLQSGPLTNGKLSQQQQQSGAVSGNTTDNKAPAGATSGSTTTDFSSGTTTAVGAKPAPTPAPGSSPAPSDPNAGSPGTGGTGGATCVANPFTHTTC